MSGILDQGHAALAGDQASGRSVPPQRPSLDEAVRIAGEIARREPGADPFAANVRAMRLPMIITDPRRDDNPVVFANDAFCDMTGYARHEIIGRNCRFLQGPETDPEALAQIRTAVAAGRTIEIELRNHRKTGEAFWNRLLIGPVYDAQGRLAYFYANQMDVTLERERLAALEHRNAVLVAELAERLRAQQESESRLRFATTAGRLGVWEFDRLTGELSASPIWREGADRDPAVPAATHTMLGVVHAEDRQRVAAAFARTLREGGHFAEEFGVVRPDGSVCWLDLRAQVVHGPDGAPPRMSGTSADITARHAAECRLELSEAHLRLATEAAEIGTWDLDMATDVLTWSDRTKAMFGFAPGAQCSMADFYAGLHEEDRPVASAAFAAAIDPDRRATYDVEYRTVGHDDGIIRWVAAKGRALFVEGRCTRAMGTAIDITQRKSLHTAQTMLLALTERMRMATDPVSIVSGALEALGRHLGVQRAGYGQVQDDGQTILLDTGYAEGLPPLSGLFPLDVFGPENMVRHRAGHAMVICDTRADPNQAEVDWQRWGIGALVSVPLIRGGAFRASLFINNAGPRVWTPREVDLIKTVASLIWDTVERARAEEALRQLNATLEARVELRTAELRQAEEALRQSQKMEAIGQLTGGIAHDFNNLLTGIVGSLELLQRRVADGRIGDLRRYADMAVTSANRAAALTQRLLAFSRRQPLDPRPVEVNRLLTGMDDLLRRTLGPAIGLEIRQAAGLWATVCDPNQLESAILNLAINARDAMGGSVGAAAPSPLGWRLTIATGNVELDEDYARAQGGEVAPGQYVVISVADTGGGMTPEVIERAFEPFFTTKPEGQGTGLGLSMLYGFIRQSRGHVRIFSEPGRGTTFRLYLPRGGRRSDDLAAMPGVFTPLRVGAGERVLVVEDEPAVRALIMETLTDLGFSAVEANDGPAALHIVRAGGALDLMIADFGLPGMNGREVADAVRALRPGLKVLFITGFDDAGGGLLEAGMQLLAKPFTMQALAAKLRAMMAP
jgi:PAS domain S-box-containing protein